MSEIYSAITGQFDFLKGYGLVFDYVESKGKLGDRYLKKFSYCNINLGKKFEIVYCTTDLYSRLHGYLVKSDLENKNQLDPQNIIPFDRLRYFFEEGGEVIFFGNEQFDFLYKLKELKLVAERFLTCVISNSWINYA